jgi:cytochrome c-type biogenesis protein CcmE
MQGRGKTTKWLFGGAVIAAAVVALSFLNLGDNLVYFYTPGEAYAKAATLEGQNIKVGGMIKPGAVDWKPETLSLNFVLTDLKGVDINVAHNGTPPDMFKEGQGVVVEGRISEDGKTLVSKSLMVKHSEEYKKPDDHGSMNKALLEKSLFKDESK